MAASAPLPVSDGILTASSERPVGELVEHLVAWIEQRGARVFAVIDHAAAAAAVGLSLPEATVVIFGNPVAGTPIMLAEPLAALELPLRILIWRDGPTSRVSTATAATLATRIGLDAAAVPALRVAETAVEALAAR